MKKTWVIIGILAGGLLLAPLIVPIFAPWSGINCRYEDINIKTGQARYSRSLWFLKVSEEIKDTPLSVALQGARVDVADIKPWHRVNTFSPGGQRSPHYIFHDALSQAHRMEMISTVSTATPEQKQEIAITILTLWQETGGDSGADEYIQRLMEQAVSNDEVEARR